MALADVRTNSVRVFDLAGVELYTFGKRGKGHGEFSNPVALCPHPNGNLLVVEHGLRVQEVTWTGDHVRFISSFPSHGFCVENVHVSPDGSFIAVCGIHGAGVIGLLDGRTCAPLAWVGPPHTTLAPCNVRLSPDGNSFVAIAYGMQTLFGMHLDGNGALTSIASVGSGIGADNPWEGYHCVEFTAEGDVVLATHRGATVFSSTTLEPVRSWAWPARVRYVQAIQAHRGVLYVACIVCADRNMEVHVYG